MSLINKNELYILLCFLNPSIIFIVTFVNVYHSNNSFSKKQRGNATLYNINTLYIDLDCHDENIQIDYDRALEFLETLFYDVKIPKPTFTVMSGRGFHLYWAIETAPKQAIYLWKLLQVRLAQELSNITTYVPGLVVDESSIQSNGIIKGNYLYTDLEGKNKALCS